MPESQPLLDPVGLPTPNVPSERPRLFARRGVTESDDLRRILTLPRRALELDTPEAREAAELISAEFRAPGGAQTLHPIQAVALAEIHDVGGLLGPIPVGFGKTHISLLAGAVLNAKRPLLIIPAKLAHKTTAEMAALQRHWRFPIPEILSYEKLSLTQYKTFLWEYRPDLIVCDECHRLKDSRGPRARRLRQYLTKAQQRADATAVLTEEEAQDGEGPASAKVPFCHFVALSGTLTSRSLKDYAHLAAWALGEGSPLPRRYPDLVEWASALDEKVQEGARLAPGALMYLCDEIERRGPFQIDPVTTTRKAFSRRFLSTPGVVGATSGSIDCALNVSATVIKLPHTIDQHFHTLRSKWETPSGIPFSFAPQLWAYARQLASGMFYEWDPQPPIDWMMARKEWASFCRETSGKRYGGQTWDTEKDIANGIDDGIVPDPFGVLSDWRGIRGSFKPNSVPVWVDDTAVNYALNWGRDNRGVIWVEHGAFGERLAREGGWRYFRSGGMDAKGPIEGTSPDSDHTIIASIASNGEGRNMQIWADALVTSPPTTNMQWEQMLGRLHRQGQKADEVNYEVMLGCIEAYAAMEQSIADARYQNETQQTPQKLLTATLALPGASGLPTTKAWVK